jgi:hypothetical protein
MRVEVLGNGWPQKYPFLVRPRPASIEHRSHGLVDRDQQLRLDATSFFIHVNFAIFEGETSGSVVRRARCERHGGTTRHFRG